MNIKHFSAIICLGILFSFFATAQQTVKVEVIDKKTQKGIPFAGVVLDSVHGTMCDENGKLSIVPEKPQGKIKIRVSCIGYEPVITSIDIAKASHTIAIEPKAYQLNAITIQPEKWKKMEIGGTKKENNYGNTSSIGMQVALLVKSPSSVNIMQRISFYIEQNEASYLKFRAVLYTKNPTTGYPDQPFLEENIILEARKGRRWVNYDMSKYNITIPESGIYLAMECVPEKTPVFDKRKAIIYSPPHLSLRGYSVNSKDPNNLQRVVIKNEQLAPWKFYEESLRDDGLPKDYPLYMPKIKCEILVKE